MHGVPSLLLTRGRPTSVPVEKKIRPEWPQYFHPLHLSSSHSFSRSKTWPHKLNMLVGTSSHALQPSKWRATKCRSDDPATSWLLLDRARVIKRRTHPIQTNSYSLSSMDSTPDVHEEVWFVR